MTFAHEKTAVSTRALPRAGRISWEVRYRSKSGSVRNPSLTFRSRKHAKAFTQLIARHGSDVADALVMAVRSGSRDAGEEIERATRTLNTVSTPNPKLNAPAFPLPQDDFDGPTGTDSAQNQQPDGQPNLLNTSLANLPATTRVATLATYLRVEPRVLRDATRDGRYPAMKGSAGWQFEAADVRTTLAAQANELALLPLSDARTQFTQREALRFNDLPDLLTVGEAARVLGYATTTITDFCKSAEIAATKPASKAWVIPRLAIAAFVFARTS